MKALNLSNTIHIHPLFFLLAISALLTGAIYPFIVLFSLVLIHECGHFFMAKYYGWRVTRMEIWLFGGAVVSEEHHSRPIREQVHVILAGPVQHIWIFGLLFLLESTLGSHPLLSTAWHYNGLLLIFNLLPIWPLDGGKLLFHLFSRWATFRNTQLLTLAFSLCFLMSVAGWMTLHHYWTLAAVWLAGFLILEHVLEWKRRYYVLMRYWLYRSSKAFPELPDHYVSVRGDAFVRDLLRSMRATSRQVFVLKQQEGSYIVNEQECLEAFFNRNRADLRVQDVPKRLQ
ncbi:site-2 protease family protein [Halobacillus litoralis]|uniref:site-2 protease family protein n=1 Tax=Halobacillus litoralis TaxID=45668 RepID=UPI001CD7D793|nr:site-2 protease family protein [Halobacillus litoralis]MCA0969941.1 site-2 protease family protein [Halobacillus litoralis]